MESTPIPDRERSRWCAQGLADQRQHGVVGHDRLGGNALEGASHNAVGVHGFVEILGSHLAHTTGDLVEVRFRLTQQVIGAGGVIKRVPQHPGVNPLV